MNSFSHVQDSGPPAAAVRCGLATTGGQTSVQGSLPFTDASGRLRRDLHIPDNLQADGPVKALVDET